MYYHQYHRKNSDAPCYFVRSAARRQEERTEGDESGAQADAFSTPLSPSLRT